MFVTMYPKRYQINRKSNHLSKESMNNYDRKSKNAYAERKNVRDTEIVTPAELIMRSPCASALWHAKKKSADWPLFLEINNNF